MLPERVRGQFAATPFDSHAGEFRVCECDSNLDPFDMDPHDGKGDNKVSFQERIL
jgi:hypothetical protein